MWHSSDLLVAVQTETTGENLIVFNRGNHKKMTESRSESLKSDIEKVSPHLSPDGSSQIPMTDKKKRIDGE